VLSVQSEEDWRARRHNNEAGRGADRSRAYRVKGTHDTQACPPRGLSSVVLTRQSRVNIISHRVRHKVTEYI
jgi:hypothetical protein